MSSHLSIHGRGALGNPGNRFEPLHYEKGPDDVGDDDRPAPSTTLLKDNSRSLITTNDSPDVGFEASINPYRGCEHGCIYCYARPAAVFVSVTTLDAGLARLLEPRATQPAGRLQAIADLAAAQVPVGVLVAPVIPGLTDHEMPAILAAAHQAGALYAGYVVLRLPLGVGPLFEQWLTQHFPDKKEKVLGRIRLLRGGKLNDSRFGTRMKGEGILAQSINDMFTLACRKAGIGGRGPTLSTASFRRPGETPRSLFE